MRLRLAIGLGKIDCLAKAQLQSASVKRNQSQLQTALHQSKTLRWVLMSGLCVAEVS
jgi:hypothetical protein